MTIFYVSITFTPDHSFYYRNCSEVSQFLCMEILLQKCCLQWRHQFVWPDTQLKKRYVHRQTTDGNDSSLKLNSVYAVNLKKCFGKVCPLVRKVPNWSVTWSVFCPLCKWRSLGDNIQKLKSKHQNKHQIVFITYSSVN